MQTTSSVSPFPRKLLSTSQNPPLQLPLISNLVLTDSAERPVTELSFHILQVTAHLLAYAEVIAVPALWNTEGFEYLVLALSIVLKLSV